MSDEDTHSSDESSDEAKTREERRLERYAEKSGDDIDVTDDFDPKPRTVEVVERFLSGRLGGIIIVAVIGFVLFGTLGNIPIGDSVPGGDVPDIDTIDVGASNDLPPMGIDQNRSVQVMVTGLNTAEIFGVRKTGNSSQRIPSYLSPSGVRLPGEGRGFEPGRFGLANTRENRTCLRRVREMAWQVARESAQNKTFNAVLTDAQVQANNTFSRRAILVSREQISYSSVLLYYGLGHPSGPTAEREQHVTAARYARTNESGVWSCPNVQITMPGWTKYSNPESGGSGYIPANPLLVALGDVQATEVTTPGGAFGS